MTPITLFKATRAAHVAKDEKMRDVFWAGLMKQSPEGLKIGDRELSVQDLEREIKK